MCAAFLQYFRAKKHPLRFYNILDQRTLFKFHANMNICHILGFHELMESPFSLVIFVDAANNTYAFEIKCFMDTTCFVAEAFSLFSLLQGFFNFQSPFSFPLFISHIDPFLFVGNSCWKYQQMHKFQPLLPFVGHYNLRFVYFYPIFQGSL